MNLNEIGKILFIDDDYATITDATSAFLENGIQVQYWKGSGELPSSIFNVRIVIVDLDLTNLQIRSFEDSFYIPAVDALSKIPGPFIVIILAREFDPRDPGKLKEVYNRRVGSPFCGFISAEGLTKDKLENPSSLEKLIVRLLNENEVLHLILAWEGAFDKAKDQALKDIMLYDVNAPVRALVSMLSNNYIENKVTARELMDVMTRLVSRRANENVVNLVRLINEINKSQLQTDYPEFEDLRLYSKLMFYKPSKEEDIATGDLYETHDRFKYALVLSPKCDLIQGKTSKALVCYGFPLQRKYFSDLDFPPHKIDVSISKLHEKKNETTGKPLHTKEYIADHAENRYFRESLPSSFPIMWNFSPEEGIFGICLNFNNMESVDLRKIKKKWTRLSRVDSPYIEDILQKYGSYVSRIGTLQINQSPFKLQEEMAELRKEKSKEKKKTKAKKKAVTNAERKKAQTAKRAK